MLRKLKQFSHSMDGAFLERILQTFRETLATTSLSPSERRDALAILVRMWSKGVPSCNSELLLHCIHMTLNGCNEQHILGVDELTSFSGRSPLNPYTLEPWPSLFSLGTEGHAMLFMLTFQMVDLLGKRTMNPAEVILVFRILLLIPCVDMEERVLFLSQCLPGVISSISKWLQKDAIASNFSEITILAIKVFEVWIFHTLSDQACEHLFSNAGNQAIDVPFFGSLPTMLQRDMHWFENCQRRILPLISMFISLLDKMSLVVGHLLLSLITLLLTCKTLFLPWKGPMLIGAFSLSCCCSDLSTMLFSPLKIFSTDLIDILETYAKDLDGLFLHDVISDHSFEEKFRVISSIMSICPRSSAGHVVGTIVKMLQEHFDLFYDSQREDINLCIKTFKLYTFPALGPSTQLLFNQLSSPFGDIAFFDLDSSLIWYLVSCGKNDALIDDCFAHICSNFDQIFNGDIMGGREKSSSDVPVFSLEAPRRNILNIKIPTSTMTRAEDVLDMGPLSLVGTSISSTCNERHNHIVAALKIILKMDMNILGKSPMLFSLIPKLLWFWGCFKDDRIIPYANLMASLSFAILGRLSSIDGGEEFSSDIEGISRFLCKNTHFLLGPILLQNDQDDANDGGSEQQALRISGLLRPLLSSSICISEIVLPNVPLMDRILSMLEEHQDDPRVVGEFLDLLLILSCSYTFKIRETKATRVHQFSLLSDETVQALRETLVPMMDDPRTIHSSPMCYDDPNEKDDTNGPNPSDKAKNFEMFIMMALPVVSQFLCSDQSQIRLMALKVVTNFFGHFSAVYGRQAYHGSPFDFPYSKQLFPLLHSSIWPSLLASLKHVTDASLFVAALEVLSSISSCCHSFVKDRMKPILKNLAKSLSFAISKIKKKGIPLISTIADRERSLLSMSGMSSALGSIPHAESRYLEMLSCLLDHLAVIIDDLGYMEDKDTILAILASMNSPIFTSNDTIPRQAVDVLKNRLKLLKTIDAIAPHLSYYNILLLSPC